jgi:hypothetical protein
LLIGAAAQAETPKRTAPSSARAKADCSIMRRA